jgi:hypothetical protein
VNRAPSLAREAVLSALAAATLAALLAWLGPPGSDLAAHAYQRTVFLQHGFELWNNFWYAGRYSFVTYSVLYYPLAALLGIRLLAVATVATAALAFAVVIGREWGPTARWSSRTFAVVWAGIVLSAAFPFALGIALALVALWAVQGRRHWRFAGLAALTLAASPVAFLLLVVLLGGIALARHAEPARLRGPAAVIVVTGALEALLWRLFPDSGRYPFSFAELAPVVGFCLLGAALAWRVADALVLRMIFLVYLGACLFVYVVPSAVGENIARLRFAAVPLGVLLFSLRRWRPWPAAVILLALALSWNLSPYAASFAKGRADGANKSTYWSPALAFLHEHMSPSYRVEAVDTTGHWAAVYLPRAGIPVARGWFRQDDFPQNRLLYSDLGRRAYVAWLRSLGVRYVLLTTAPTDYSARGEAALLRSGRSRLVPVFRAATTTIYEVPHSHKLITGPSPAAVAELRESRIVVALSGAGTYRLAVRYSPYWKPSAGCLSRGDDGMIRLVVPYATPVTLRFDVDASHAFASLAGRRPSACSS